MKCSMLIGAKLHPAMFFLPLFRPKKQGFSQFFLCFFGALGKDLDDPNYLSGCIKPRKIVADKLPIPQLVIAGFQPSTVSRPATTEKEKDKTDDAHFFQGGQTSCGVFIWLQSMPNSYPQKTEANAPSLQNPVFLLLKITLPEFPIFPLEEIGGKIWTPRPSKHPPNQTTKIHKLLFPQNPVFNSSLLWQTQLWSLAVLPQ